VVRALVNATSDNLIRLSVLAGIFIVWQLVALALQPEMLPSPTNVLKKLYLEVSDGALLYHLLITLSRVALSFTIAMIVGFVIGSLMGWFRKVDLVLDVPLIIALNTPALVVIIICFIWFGLSNSVAILAVVLNKTPLVITTIREGVKSIDKGLLEVAQVFSVPRWKAFFHVLLPQLYPFILSCVRNGLSLIWKIVLVVELIGCSNGVGFKLGVFFQYFDIASILAYTFAFVLCILLIEALMVQPLESRSMKWRHA